jgi:anti-sigma factor RsiW
MTCRDFADFLGDYLSGELRADILARFEAHIGVCPNCVRYLAQYREAIELGRSALLDGSAAVPLEVPEELIAAILTCRSLES